MFDLIFYRAGVKPPFWRIIKKMVRKVVSAWSNFDELIQDMNRAKYGQLSIVLHLGREVVHKQMSFSGAKVKREPGKGIFFGIEGEGYLVNDDCQFFKTEDLDNDDRVIYKIKRDDIEIVGLYLYN